MAKKKGNSRPVAIGTVSYTSNTPQAQRTTTYTSPSGEPMTQQQVTKATTKPTLSNVGSNLSKKEAEKIAEAKGSSVAKVIDKALSKGLTIGSALVNAYNKGSYTSPRDAFWQSVGSATLGANNMNKLSGTSNNIAGLAGLNLNKGQVYGGAYSRDGAVTPLVTMKIKSPGTTQKDTSTSTDTTTTTTDETSNLSDTDIQSRIDEGIAMGIQDYMMGIEDRYNQQDQAYLDMLNNMSSMFSQQMGSMFDPLQQAISGLTAQEPMRLYGAGENYNVGGVRSGFSRPRPRSNYLRGGMSIGGNGMSPIGIAASGLSGLSGALGSLGGLTI
jgi:hypothetical protein